MEAVNHRAFLPLPALILLSAVLFLLAPALTRGTEILSILLSKALFVLSQRIIPNEEFGIVYPRSRIEP